MDNSDGLEPETAEQWLDRVGVVLCTRHLHGPVGTVGAEREFKRAFELNPSHAECHHQYSHLLLMLGRVNDSFVESKKYLELDPVSQSPISHLAYHYLYSRQYDDAIREYEKERQLFADTRPVRHIRLGQPTIRRECLTSSGRVFTRVRRNGSSSRRHCRVKKSVRQLRHPRFLSKANRAIQSETSN